jgi:hypothetical protein
MNPPDEQSVLRSNLYLIHKTQKRKASKPTAEFEPAISANERSLTHTFDSTAAGISLLIMQLVQLLKKQSRLQQYYVKN